MWLNIARLSAGSSGSSFNSCLVLNCVTTASSVEVLVYIVYAFNHMEEEENANME